MHVMIGYLQMSCLMTDASPLFQRLLCLHKKVLAKMRKNSDYVTGSSIKLTIFNAQRKGERHDIIDIGFCKHR